MSERQLFSESFGNTYERAFSYAWHGEKGERLALFSRLNKQGLLEEIEKRQAKLAMLPGPQKIVSEKLRELTQKISSKDLSTSVLFAVLVSILSLLSEKSLVSMKGLS